MVVYILAGFFLFSLPKEVCNTLVEGVVPAAPFFYTLMNLVNRSRSMVIEYHHKYLEHLARRYLSIYGKYGYDEAKKWFDEFLTKELRVRVKPIIHTVANDQGLNTHEEEE